MENNEVSYEYKNEKVEEVKEKDDKVYWTVKEEKEKVPFKERAYKVAPIVSFIWSFIELIIGVYKLYFYNNGESYPYNYVNAYVGGDAYNYIINSGKATAHFVLCIGLLISGILFLILKEVRKNKEN